MKNRLFVFLLLIEITAPYPLLSDEIPSASSYIGINEKLGHYPAFDTTFIDEEGKIVTLKQIVNKPTILSFVYYDCPGLCTPLLTGLSEAIDKLDMEPAKDYTVITVSFNPKDTYQTAAKKRKNYLNSLERKYPVEGWRFLTGDINNIKRLTDSAGFYYKKDGEQFLHPVALVILSPDGKIVRYLYGVSFLPFDLKMALTEASEGRTGASINKAIKYCFNYDPKSKRYTFNMLKVAGITMLLFIAGLIFFLTRNKKPEKSREN